MHQNHNEEFGIFVVCREGESITSLLRRFKRKVTKSEVLKEYRRKTEYIKPSVRKRNKSKEARKREEKERMKAEKDQAKKLQKRKKMNTERSHEEYENTTGD